MADYYDYIREQGIIVPDTSTVQADIQNEWKGIFGSQLSVETSTPQGRIIEAQTMGRVFALGFGAAVANQLNIDIATGQFLDAIGAFFGVSRRSETRTEVIATLSGVAGTTVPSGSIAKTSNGDSFYLSGDVVLTGGSADGIFVASDSGKILCSAGELNSIVSNVVGWEMVNNNAGATKVGAPRESDDELRKRIKECRYQGTSLVGNISSALYNIEGVKTSYIYNNGTGASVSISDSYSENLQVNPHSVFVVAYGGDDYAIANALYEKISAGCGQVALYHIEIVLQPSVGDKIIIGKTEYEFGTDITIGADTTGTATNVVGAISGNSNVEATNVVSGVATNKIDISSLVRITIETSTEGVISISDNVRVVNISDSYFGTSYSMIFNRPIAVPIYVSVNAKNISYAGGDATASIRSAITEWAAGNVATLQNLEIGSDISPALLSYVITSQVSGIYIDQIQVSLDGNTWKDDSIVINKDKLATFDTSNITVNFS